MAEYLAQRQFKVIVGDESSAPVMTDNGSEVSISNNVEVGDCAFDVLSEIISLHPEIKGINLIFYDFETSSFEGEFTENISLWIPTSLVNRHNLEEISKFYFNFQDNGYLMAVSSKVLLENDDYAHIPMMDFDGDFWERLVRRIKNVEGDVEINKMELAIVKFCSIPGVILDSGASYHYWGFTLLSEEEWKEVISNWLEVESKRKSILNRPPIYDEGFLAASLKRGYSGLRIFGYKDTDKDVEPTVEALVR